MRKVIDGIQILVSGCESMQDKEIRAYINKVRPEKGVMLKKLNITIIPDSPDSVILDKLCQMESNAKDNEIARLRSDLQAAQLTLAQSVQTQNIVSTLKPPPVPAYVVGNPYCNCGNIASGTTIV